MLIQKVLIFLHESIQKVVAISDPFELKLKIHFEARYGLPKFEKSTSTDLFFTGSARI